MQQERQHLPPCSLYPEQQAAAAGLGCCCSRWQGNVELLLKRWQAQVNGAAAAIVLGAANGGAARGAWEGGLDR
jgi:hypothetical protein